MYPSSHNNGAVNACYLILWAFQCHDLVCIYIYFLFYNEYLIFSIIWLVMCSKYYKITNLFGTIFGVSVYYNTMIFSYNVSILCCYYGVFYYWFQMVTTLGSGFAVGPFCLSNYIFIIHWHVVSCKFAYITH